MPASKTTKRSACNSDDANRRRKHERTDALEASCTNVPSVEPVVLPQTIEDNVQITEVPQVITENVQATVAAQLTSDNARVGEDNVSPTSTISDLTMNGENEARPDDGNQPRETVKSDATSIISGQSISFGEAFAKLTGQCAPKVQADTPTKPTAFLEEVSRRTASTKPAQCAVTDVSLQDKLLKEDYKTLPPLARGQLKSWSDREGFGTIRFSGWNEICPKVEYHRTKGAIQFVNDGRYVNPSRVDPDLLSARDTSGNDSRYIAEVKVDDKWITAIFLTPLCLIQSHLHDQAREYKFVTGVAHSQEWERMVAVFCMIMGVEVLNAQVVGSELQFSMKPATRSSAYSRSQLGASSVMVNSSPSPASVRMKTSRTAIRRAVHVDGSTSAFVRSVLEATDKVPVFDARNYSLPIDFTSAQLSHLESTLPLFNGEIPEGSMATVAYTVSYYYRDNDRSWNLSTNLQWILVFGCPA